MGVIASVVEFQFLRCEFVHSLLDIAAAVEQCGDGLVGVGVYICVGVCVCALVVLAVVEWKL